MIRMRIVIIEDETPALKRLQRMVMTACPQAEIIATYDSVEDSVAGLNVLSEIDLIFMDIQLADGISLDIFQKVKVTAPVIFTTAFDHYAVKAFKVNSIDYLLKPVDEKELAAAISKFEARQQSVSEPDYHQIIQAIREQKQPFKQRFLVKTAGRLTFVPTNEVAYFFSDDGNTFLTTNGRDRFLIENTLEEIEGMLDPSVFFRISRKMIMSLHSIKRIEPHLNNRYVLEVHPEFEEEVVVSRQRSAEFRQWLDR